MATKSTTTTVSTIDTDVRLARYREVAASMLAKDSDDPQLDIIAQIMEAGTLDELLGNGVTQLADMLNVPFTIKSAELRKSDFAEGLGVYAVLQAKLDGPDGANLVITTGAETICAQVVKATAEGWMPLRCVAVEAKKPTAKGYYPQRLQSAPESF